MKNKSSQVDKIKQCLNKNIPLTNIEPGGMIVGGGCDNSDSAPSLTGMPLQKPQNEPETVEKIEFDDNDFSSDLDSLSSSGVQKLEDFIKYVEEKYGYNLQHLKIDIVWGNAEETDERKRKKAQAVHRKFSYVYGQTPGISLTARYIIAGKIANKLDREFNFIEHRQIW